MRPRGAQPALFWPLLFALPVGLMLLNAVLRVVGLFPHEVSDEGNWSRLFYLIGQGYEPPVSGPLFVWLVNEIYDHLPFPSDSVISSLAILSSGALYTLLIWGYQKVLVHRDIVLGAALMLLMTSYFLAPAIEARPQQLGVALTFIICLSAMDNTSRLPIWLPVALTLLMFWHVLSFFVAVAYLTLWMLAKWRLGLLGARKFSCWVLICGLLMLVLGQSQGYHPLFRDVFSNHAVTPFALVLSGVTATVVVLGILAIPLSVWGRLKGALQDNRFGAVPALLGLSALPLALQWYLLPGASLAHYRVPGTISFIWQAGNLAFLVCYIQGLKSFAESEDRQLRPFVHGSLIVGVLAVAALSASYFLAHTNWMIRLLYYWIPFAAPVSLLGFRQLFLKFKLLGYAAGLSFILASLSHTVRYGVP